MVELIDVLRAKSKKDEHYLLKEHIKDTLERAVQIWEFVNKNRERIEYEKLKSRDTFKNLAKALFLHDMGKIDYGFQKRVFDPEEKKDDNEEWQIIKEFFTPSGRKYPVDFRIKDHEILSVIHTAVFTGEGEWDKIRTAILLHHYNKFFVEREQHIIRILDDYPQIAGEEYPNYLSLMIEKKEELRKIYESLIEYIRQEFVGHKDAEFILEALEELEINMDKLDELKRGIESGFGVSRILPLYELYVKNEEDALDFFVFLGLLRRCDYSASAGPDVSAEKPYSIEKEIMAELPEKIKNKLKLEKMWQEELIENYKDKEDIILIAPTGSGKTEFALLWAREKGKKLFYTLPLRVALNDLFLRFSGEDSYFEKEYVDLLHSTAFIEYLKGESRGEDISISEKLKEVRLFASPILLTTPDQVFLSSLKYYGFDKLLSLYPTSTVVIDEIQAYDPEMAAIIIKTLEMIKEVKGNILVITATFPPYYEKFLIDGDGINLEIEKVDLRSEKNRISVPIKNYDLRRHRIDIRVGNFVIERKEDHQKKYEISKEKLKEIIDKEHPTQNVLIIVNNVLKAIEVFRALKDDYAHIKLLHSRLIEKEKGRRISEIKDFLNKKKSGEIPENERIIVISTQLVEASVDFDFDVLITEISPIDSQVQRWGRVYRTRDDNYDGKLPNIYIFSEIDNGTKAIYHPEEVLERTLEVLQEKTNEKGVLGYVDERALIEKVYSTPKIKEHYENEIQRTLEWLNLYHASKKSEAQRIFRKLAGVQLVIPQLMIDDGENEKIKELGKILQSGENYERWTDISKKVFGEGTNSVEKLRVLRWMYEYSIQVPEYALHRYLKGSTQEFLGFYILNIKESKKMSEIKEFGIDILREDEGDLDEWIEQYNNIL